MTTQPALPARASTATRVGIMSMQRIANYGSTLQAYGLRRLIEDVADPVRVSYVDFRPGDVLPGEPGVAVRSSRAGRAVAKAREYGRGDARWRDRVRFLNHKRRYADRYLPLIGVPPRRADPSGLDVQVVGSDEVFNCLQANPNVGYSRDLFGHGSTAPRLLSYAASFGNATLDRIRATGIAPDLARDLSRFAEISVRDRNSADIVEALTGARPLVHVDPVLAYDFPGSEDRIPRRRLQREPYLLLYGYGNRFDRRENAAVREHARRAGLKVVCLGGVQDAGDEFVDCDPFELLAYFRDAEAVVTDTFHGTIFAIINGCRFATVVRPTRGQGYGNEEKVGFLLDSFGLSSQRLDHIGRLDEVLDAPVDRAAVVRTLERERERTRGYLARAIG